jgi:hypothetical protein
LTGSANASPLVVSWNYLINSSSNDYYELMWSTSNLNVEIVKDEATSTYPLIPSVIATITQQSGIMSGTGISPLDTASMLSPYARTNVVNASLATKLNISDTASMLSSYSTRINSKVNISDTSNMLSNYRTAINAKLNISDTSVLQRKSIPSYTFLANNTTSTANAQALTFKDTSGTYTGTITWGTSAPTGATNHSYRWTRIGNMVTLNISLVYGTASSGNTQVTIALPSDAPTPAKPVGTNSASAFLYPATCVGGTTLTASTSVATNRGGIRNNSSNNGFEINMAWTSASTFIYFQTSVTYFTN